MKKSIHILAISIAVWMLFLQGCKKEDPVNKPVVTTSTITDITAVAAKGGGEVTNNGGAAVTARGICWNTTGNPTTADTKTNNGNGTGSFTADLNNLSTGTTYYVRAWATNSAGTGYGNEVSFTTADGAVTLTTTPVTELRATTAMSGGEITDDGGAAITGRGVCWNTTGSPTIDDDKTSDGSGMGSFTSDLSGLTRDTKYYLRAYATNAAGTFYGNEIVFVTRTGIPDITTNGVTDITATTARSGGDIKLDNGADVLVRGVCWNTTGSPTIDDDKTEDGSGAGPFTSEMTGLQGSTLYYVRAYATTQFGTVYGDEQTFTTEFQCGGTFVDERDGKTYKTVQIGDQCWMAENLNVGVMILDTYNQGNNATIEKHCYGNDSMNCVVYGGLYQWNEMMDYQPSSDANPSGVQGICPVGWHLPSDAEWTQLSDYLGGGTVAGAKMKEVGTEHWNDPNMGATNESGFTALPGGYRPEGGGFGHLGHYAEFWSTTGGANGAWSRELANNVITFGTYASDKRNSYSVRCLKDD